MIFTRCIMRHQLELYKCNSHARGTRGGGLNFATAGTPVGLTSEELSLCTLLSPTLPKQTVSSVRESIDQKSVIKPSKFLLLFGLGLRIVFFRDFLSIATCYPEGEGD